MKSKVIGLVILAVIIVAALVIQFGGIGDSQTITVKGYVGGEKIGFLKDEEVRNILKKKYGLEVDYTKAGSIEMVREQNIEGDFLFPSSQVALEIFKNEQGTKLVKSHIVFDSPIVLYSWSDYAEKLVSAGYVTKREDVFYVTGFKKLIDDIIADKQWEEIGLELHDGIKIISTDPNKSNSGNMFSGLAANIINNGIVLMEDFNSIRDDVVKVFDKMGFMEHSSGTLFDKYITQRYPLVIGYENQLVEFGIENPSIWEDVKDEMALLYPEPTVWSSHPLIALSDNGVKLINALQDEELIDLAWRKHGFRTGLVDRENDTDALVLEVVGMPEKITRVTQMPRAEVMMKIMDAIAH